MHILIAIAAIILAIAWFATKAIVAHIAAHYAMKKITEARRKAKQNEPA